MTLKKTERDQIVLQCIRDFTAQHRYPPSVRDIQRICEISSTSVVASSINSLVEQGLIKKDSKQTRGVVLSFNDNTVPLLGEIAAGIPIPVPDNDVWNITDISETIDVPDFILKGRKNVYALRVKGQSMIDALINDDDIVLIEYISSVNNGDMAVVWLDNENTATLKYVFYEGKNVRLQPANSSMQPIIKKAEHVVVQGKVIGVLRAV